MIYICSPYAGNTEENTAFARQACGYAIRQGAVPLAPHLLYPQILNDSVPEEREIGIRLGLDILERCEELWICGDRMSAGMKRETAYAKARGIPVRRIPVCEIMGNSGRWILWCCYCNCWLCISILRHCNGVCLHLLSLSWTRYGTGHSFRATTGCNSNDCISRYFIVNYGVLWTKHAS